MKKNKLYKEAEIFGKYLVNDEVSEEQKLSYIKAIQKLNIKEDKSQKYIEKSIKKPYLLKYYDAALAFNKTKPVLRKKLFIMLAIIEASTTYSDKFLEKEKSSIAAIFQLIYLGLISITSFIIGWFIIALK